MTAGGRSDVSPAGCRRPAERGLRQVRLDAQNAPLIVS
jgi:hypothetical protein